MRMKYAKKKDLKNISLRLMRTNFIKLKYGLKILNFFMIDIIFQQKHVQSHSHPAPLYVEKP